MGPDGPYTGASGGNGGGGEQGPVVRIRGRDLTFSGSLSANGGNGGYGGNAFAADNDGTGGNGGKGGKGGRGGDISVRADYLRGQASFAATGGSGGMGGGGGYSLSANPCATGQPGDGGDGGEGGAPGSVTLVGCMDSNPNFSFNSSGGNGGNGGAAGIVLNNNQDSVGENVAKGGNVGTAAVSRGGKTVSHIVQSWRSHNLLSGQMGSATYYLAGIVHPGVSAFNTLYQLI